MRTLNVEFTMSLNLVGCTKEDIVQIDVEDDATDEEIDEIINEEYTQWLFDQNQGGYQILN